MSKAGGRTTGPRFPTSLTGGESAKCKGSIRARPQNESNCTGPERLIRDLTGGEPVELRKAL
jgi:hypothetical protein